MTEIKQPKIRFKGHINDWEQRKLGDIVDYVKGYAFKSNTYVDGGVRIIRVSDLSKSEIKKSGDMIYISKKDSELFDKYIINKSDIIVTTVGSKSEMKDSAVGRPIMVRSADEGLLNQNLVKLETKNKYNSYFIFNNLLMDRYSYYISLIERGNANQANITINDLWEYSLYTPNISEQTEIGEFFKTLDVTIALHQQKLEVTKQFKQTMLKKMFPKNGETTPEIRFKGFTDDWEERSLESLYSKSGSGGTPKTNNNDYYNGDINFLNISDLSDSKGLILNTEKTITNKGLINSSAWIVPKGAISLAMYASVGKVAILGVESSTSQAFFNMVFDDDTLRDLIYQILIKAYNFNEWDNLVSYGTQPNLNSKKIKNFKIKIPKSKQEQLLIGDFLNNLDMNIYIVWKIK